MKSIDKKISCWISLTKGEFTDAQFWAEMVNELELPPDTEEVDCEIVAVCGRIYTKE